jgi:hypothetical protein
MNKPYKYKFQKQGANVALVAISSRKLSKATQCKILNAYLTPKREAGLRKASGQIIIYNNGTTRSMNDPRRVS